MAAPADTAQSIREALAPFVRSREEATHIRRVLRAHLAACLKSDDALDGSLALVDLPWDVVVLPEARGLQRAYLRALQANLEARRAFEERYQAVTSRPATRAAADTPRTPAGHKRAGSRVHPVPSALDIHLTAARRARKQERLQAVLRYLDALGDKPAVAAGTGEDFLQLDAVYAEATQTLPPVPAAVLEGVAEAEAEHAAVAGPGESGGWTGPPPTTVAGLDRLVAHVEKAVLRKQMLLREEEKRLATAKTRAAPVTGTAADIPAAAKLRALGAARDELIAWMETELGNAAGKGEEEEEEGCEDDAEEESRLLRQSLLEDGEGDNHRQRAAAPLKEKLGDIRRQYAEYVDARRALVHTVEEMAGGGSGGGGSRTAGALLSNMPRLPPPGEGGALSWLKRPAASTTDVPTATPTAQGATPEADHAASAAAALGQLLLIPYLERLQAVAREQKADIAHKAHYTAVLARRRKETSQMLDRLADESQLLPRYPVPGGGAQAHAKNNTNNNSLLAGGRDAPDSASQRVAAWIYAAESAKIATFEAVAEQLEDGQAALEKVAATLEEVDALLGRQRRPEGGAAEGGSDIWATLNGELGLLKAEEGRRRR